MKILLEIESLNKYNEVVKNLVDISSFFNIGKLGSSTYINQDETVIVRCNGTVE